MESDKTDSSYSNLSSTLLNCQDTLNNCAYMLGELKKENKTLSNMAQEQLKNGGAYSRDVYAEMNQLAQKSTEAHEKFEAMASEYQDHAESVSSLLLKQEDLSDYIKEEIKKNVANNKAEAMKVAAEMRRLDDKERKKYQSQINHWKRLAVVSMIGTTLILILVLVFL